MESGTGNFLVSAEVKSGKLRFGSNLGTISVADNVPFIGTSLSLRGTNAAVSYLNGGSPNQYTQGSKFIVSSPLPELAIGAVGTGHARDLEGAVGEVITYNRKVSEAERKRIESYLALKYGITLNSVDYLDSVATTVWDAAANDSYANDIAGIGIDIDSGLSQLSSQSVNSDRIVTMIGTAGTVTGGEFLIWGNDDGGATFHGLGTVSNVATANSRFGRIWKAQETGDVGTVSIEFDSSLLEAGRTYCLLTDNDEDFTNGGTTEVACTVASGTMASFSHDFDVNAPFFTIGLVIGGTITGTVFDDFDGNGVLDANETGVGGYSGIAVTLLGRGADDLLGTADDHTVDNTTTNSDGVYTFSDITADGYRVVAANPSNSTSVTPDDVTAIVLADKTTTINFAEVGVSRVVGRVFADKNGNNIFDAEFDTGLDNVALELFAVGADGMFGTADDVSTDTTTTNSDGLYVFTDVGAGSFSVVETDPTGYMSVGSNHVDVTLLATGAAVASFADIETGTVSGIVFMERSVRGMMLSNKRQQQQSAAHSNLVRSLLATTMYARLTPSDTKVRPTMSSQSLS